MVLAVQVIPSGDVAATFEEFAIVTKVPFPKVTGCQFEELGKVLAVQVIPSGDVAAKLEPRATVTKNPFL